MRGMLARAHAEGRAAASGATGSGSGRDGPQGRTPERQCVSARTDLRDGPARDGPQGRTSEQQCVRTDLRDASCSVIPRSFRPCSAPVAAWVAPPLPRERLARPLAAVGGSKGSGAGRWSGRGTRTPMGVAPRAHARLADANSGKPEAVQPRRPGAPAGVRGRGKV